MRSQPPIESRSGRQEWRSNRVPELEAGPTDRRHAAGNPPHIRHPTPRIAIKSTLWEHGRGCNRRRNCRSEKGMRRLVTNTKAPPPRPRGGGAEPGQKALHPCLGKPEDEDGIAQRVADLEVAARGDGHELLAVHLEHGGRGIDAG